MFARALGRPGDPRARLLVVGSPDDEPWHFTAHLRDHAERSGRTDLTPALLRWQVPPAAAPHLSRSVDELSTVGRDQTVLVLSPTSAPPALLERVDGAYRAGARVLALHRGDRELEACSHEVLEVPSLVAPAEVEVTTHAVSELAPMRGDGRDLLGRAPRRWARTLV